MFDLPRTYRIFVYFDRFADFQLGRLKFGLRSKSRMPPVDCQEFYLRPLPRHCVALTSVEGKTLFRDALLSGYMENYFSLASQLCTQDEPAYCGLTTLVMVLNAFGIDPGRVWKSPWRWYHESMLSCCLPPDIFTEGIVLDQFIQIAQCYGLEVDLFRVYSDKDSLAIFRNVVMKLTSGQQPGFLVVSYSRRALGQTGSGHFASIGGYDPASQMVLVLETARFKYPCHWVSLARLWFAMSLNDHVTQLPRGYIILRKAPFITNCNDNLQLTQQTTAKRRRCQVLGENAPLISDLVGENDKAHSLSNPSLKAFFSQWIDFLYSTGDSTNDLDTSIRFLLNTDGDLNPASFCLAAIHCKSSLGLDENDATFNWTPNDDGGDGDDVVAELFNSPIARSIGCHMNVNLSCIAHNSSSAKRFLSLVTFVYAFPYNHVLVHLTTHFKGDQIELINSRVQTMICSVQEASMSLSDRTRMELFAVEHSLWTSISSFIDTILAGPIRLNNRSQLVERWRSNLFTNGDNDCKD